MVGALTAAALGACGLDVVMLEQKPPPPFDGASYDLRVSALSEASERMLDAVGAWSQIQQLRLCPYRRMLVWDSETSAKTLFDSSRIGKPHLGHIVENRVIQLSLWQQLGEMDNVTVICPASVQALNTGVGHVSVNTDAGEFSGSLLVAADGANSSVRTMAGLSVEGGYYDQHALVATVNTQYPQRDITWQRFTPGGPQAFLPLAGQRASMVWYESPETIAKLKELPQREFIDAMTSAFPEELGCIASVDAKGSFPLQRQHASSYVSPRVVLVGDAAHSVHPLAGQGVNMGMLDAAELVDCVVSSYSSGKDIGSLRTLRRYERARRPANELMIRFLDGIHQIFEPGGQQWLKQAFRSAALRGAEHLTPVNELCMRTAMGLTGNLPPLARGRLPLHV